MPKASPGPWHHTVAGPNHWIVDAAGNYIAYIGARDGIFTRTPGVPHAANAEVMAAAWEMRAVLQRLIRAKTERGRSVALTAVSELLQFLRDKEAE